MQISKQPQDGPEPSTSSNSVFSFYLVKKWAFFYRRWMYLTYHLHVIEAGTACSNRLFKSLEPGKKSNICFDHPVLLSNWNRIGPKSMVGIRKHCTGRAVRSRSLRMLDSYWAHEITARACFEATSISR